MAFALWIYKYDNFIEIVLIKDANVPRSCKRINLNNLNK